MNNGFSIIEMLVAMAVSFAVFAILISNITEGVAVGRKVATRQKVLESLFFTVDTIKNDLTKCGMRLQEASELFGLELFSNTGTGFRSVYGLASEELTRNGYKGEKKIEVSDTGFMKKGGRILVYDTVSKEYEFIRVSKVEGKVLTLNSPLNRDHIKNSIVIPLREVEMKWVKKQKAVKRKIDRGYFQPVIQDVTDFYISFFEESNSVLYRLEINGKEQVRGYIFLTNRKG